MECNGSNLLNARIWIYKMESLIGPTPNKGVATLSHQKHIFKKYL